MGAGAGGDVVHPGYAPGPHVGDGFDWIADLHRRGAQVTAWTLNPDRPHHLGLAAELIEHGVDRIITDDAPRLAEALGEAVVLSV